MVATSFLLMMFHVGTDMELAFEKNRCQMGGKLTMIILHVTFVGWSVAIAK